MRRAWIGLTLSAGWLLLAGASAAPAVGMALSLLDRGRVATDLVKVPSPGRLLLYSATTSVCATVLALMAGVGPAVLLGHSRSRWRRHVLTGICAAPLLVPPQVYAYAWGLATAPHRLLASALPATSGSSAWGSAVRAGLISAGWLWPLVTLIVAAGWRTTGRNAYTLALLDSSPGRAFLRGVLPSLRGHLLAAGCVVFIITLVEYPIPHLSLARTYATELLLLVDVGAPPGQVVMTALPAVGLVAAALVVAGAAMSAVRGWGAGDDEAVGGGWPVGSNRWAMTWLVLLWSLSVIVPVIVMISSLRIAARWREAFTLFREEWLDSCGVAVAAAGVAVVITIGTVVWAGAWTKRRGAVSVSQVGTAGAVLAVLGALVPGAALGVGFVTIYNRDGVVGDLYTQTPVVWILSLAARYAVIPVVIAWLGLRKRWVTAVEQAQVDGARPGDIVGHVLLPMLWPSLVAGGAIVALLSLSEVVISQLVHPVGYPSIALTILGLMHYGRDDTVIIAALLIMGVGVLAAQLSSWLLLRRT